MKTKRIAPVPIGIPPLEPKRTELFDTREIPPDGSVSCFTFFQKPNHLGPAYTNLVASGHVPYPQQMYVFGLAMEIYSVHGHIDEKIIKSQAVFGDIRRMLLGNAEVEFIIGSKSYLNVAANSIITAIVPGSIEGLSDGVYSNPNIEEKDFEKLPDVTSFSVAKFIAPRKKTAKHKELKKDYPLNILIGNLPGQDFCYEYTISRPDEKPVILTITNAERSRHYYNLCVYIKNRVKPIHIPAQQAFRGHLRWDTPTTFDPDFLGRVYVRMGLVGILWCEVC